MRTWPLLLILSALPACIVFDDDDDDSASDDDDTPPPPFRIWSPEFVAPDFTVPSNYDCTEALPVEHACNAINPEIRWEGAPEDTVAFALIFDDPTAGNFEHWAIYNIPGDATGLDAGISGQGANVDAPEGSAELINGFGSRGYVGSCPFGINQYRWRLWALADSITGTPTSYNELASLAAANSIEEVQMCHVFDGAAVR